MAATFPELVRFFIKRRNLSVEQLANLANLSRKTLYRWVNGEVENPRHWYQIVALGKALCLSVDEVNQLLKVTKNPNFGELKELARYEYEVELLNEFAKMESASSSVPRPQIRFEPWAALEAPAGAVQKVSTSKLTNRSLFVNHSETHWCLQMSVSFRICLRFQE
ncbi:MAG: helix-turn-helix transcriptional regulator [Chloroflexi bacterium]|nr:helix-turn-helix transcriptional regulator [Chloroflexota bacterium]